MKLAGHKFRIWRAVDQHGFVLAELLQSRRNTRAAKRLLLRLLKRYWLPKRIVRTSCVPTALRSGRLRPVSLTGRIRALITAQKATFFHSDSASGRCRDVGLPVRYRDLSPFNPRHETTSPSPPAAALLLPSATTASRHSTHGKRRRWQFDQVKFQCECECECEPEELM
nr:DDE-type integrase/transposase/recombinase [Palleronia caenipelagi]